MDLNSYILHKESLQENKNKEVIYDKWAETYDSYVAGINYNGPSNIAQEVFDYLESNDSYRNHIKLLDFGCGTGLLGQEITKLLTNNYDFSIDGIDISDKMIQQSKNKNIYSHLWKLNLFNEVLSSHHQYDIIVSSGVFLEGHVKFKMVDILLNSVKHSGLLFLTVRESFRDKNLDEYMLYVAQNPRLEVIFESNMEYLPDVKCKMIILKKLF